MTVTKLDDKTALIVVDLQKGIVRNPSVHPMSDILRKAAALADAFRRHDLPVVLVAVAGTAPGRTEQALGAGPRPDDWAELAPELNVRPGDIRVTKKTWGAFRNTGLEDHLKSEGVTQVVVAGVATAIGVQSTARQAYELGFNVTLAIDAMTDRDADAHDSSVSYVFPRLGETGTTQEILSLLLARSA